MKHVQQVPESVLARIWEEQRFHPDSLKTTDGLEVQVIRRGRRNTDNGPDFRDALIRIGERVYEGDVELHLQIVDWHAHGHDTDPCYDQTILHVVLWPPLLAKNTVPDFLIHKANGGKVPTAVVRSCLSAPIEKLRGVFKRSDERKQQKIQHCQKILKDIPLDNILLRLKHLGTERLYDRARRFDSWIHSPPGRACPEPCPERSRRVVEGGEGWVYSPPAELKDHFQQLLYEAICEGLGYSSNKHPFLELARRLPIGLILSHLPSDKRNNSQDDMLHWLQAVIFGMAGLLPPQGVQSRLCKNSEPETREYVTELRSLWEMLLPCLDITPMEYKDWHFFRLRPPNFPTRRLAALSYLLLNYTVQPLFESYLQLFALFSEHPEQAVQSIRLLERTLKIPAEGYWKGRYLFGNPVFPDYDRMFLGQSRIRDIIISAVFPVFLLYARYTPQPHLESRILSLYEIFPSPSRNRVTNIIRAQLFAHRQDPVPDLHTAIIYQGMLHLYKHYCYLPTCGHCPFGSHKTE